MNMIINTTKHISDGASTVNISPVTINGKKVNNLQTLYDSIDKHIYEGTETATPTTYGIVRLASSIDSANGVLTGKLFDALKFDVYATETSYGRVKIENNDSIKNGFVGTNNVLNAKSLSKFIEVSKPTTKIYGYPKLIQNYLIMNSRDSNIPSTVENLDYAMINTIPSIGNSTTSNTGLVKIFKVSDIGNIPKANQNIVISPRVFHKLLATENSYGIIKLGNINDYNDNSSGVALIYKFIKNHINKVNSLSKTILDIEKEQNDFMAKRIPEITRIALDAINKKFGADRGILMSVGDVFYGLNNINSYNQNVVVIPSGQYLLVSEYQELFDIIGYKYGKSGNKFRLPDMRGLYLRATGISDDIKNTEEYRFYVNEKRMAFQEPILGEVQRQMVATHHHAKLWSDSYSRGTSFGRHGNNNNYGSRDTIQNGNAQYTTDGGEIISRRGIKDYPNPEGMINEDKETRPWSMAVNIYMRIK